ncbi:hypothetical protein Tco_1576719 [Tanacetum coccineum]
MSLLTPSDIQYSAATRILGVLQIGIRAKVIENQQSCLLHHLRLPTLPSTPILSQGGYFRELTRSCRMVVLHESSYTDTMDSLCSRHSPVCFLLPESPGYVTESDPEEDLEEYKDDKTKDGPVDYPMYGGEDGDDDDGDSSRDDADDEDEDEEEVEEHLAPAHSAVVVPTVELVFPPKGIEPVTPPPSTDILPLELGSLSGFGL